MNIKQQQQPLDVVIVGGGLSGVLLAHKIHKEHPTTKMAILEARGVFGGRLMNDDKDRKIDLGGAWVWPEHQPKIKALLKKTLPQLKTFKQPDDPSSTRIDGGAIELVTQLAQTLPKEYIHLDSPVAQCTLLSESESSNQCAANDDDDPTQQQQQLIRVDTKDGTSFLTKTVVLAAAPKLVSKHVQFTPPLSTPKQSAMRHHHTWMAGVTKVALEYPTAFWQNSGLSNMGLPRHAGPAFQMYDASTMDGTVKALTFFALVKDNKNDNDDKKKIADRIVAQVAMVWSHYGHGDMVEPLKGYTQVHMQQWPSEPYIAEDDNPTTVHPHPHPIPVLAKPEWNGQLLFAGSETDQESPGVMEGAVGAAQRVYAQWMSTTTTAIQQQASVIGK